MDAFAGVVLPEGFAGETVVAVGFAGEGFGEDAAAGLFLVGVFVVFFGDPFFAAVSIEVNRKQMLSKDYILSYSYRANNGLQLFYVIRLELTQNETR